MASTSFDFVFEARRLARKIVSGAIPAAGIDDHCKATEDALRRAYAVGQKAAYEDAARIVALSSMQTATWFELRDQFYALAAVTKKKVTRGG